ncbi:LOW QUALITY PROTEIN: uncharacterized protein LOC127394269 [Apus apus]|uniref:LOW QUALITY PROTEIN: uncharacterized protein LOC127394269 n=1 Tax=Apus apus TaxID=8895 RepID=UPI0021F917ED|nr:LOW QUALITY PROTEIN: uncharacterized protein LOC127394269 [Apus apus]
MSTSPHSLVSSTNVAEGALNSTVHATEKMFNSTGPNTAPWETPLVVGLHRDIEPSITTPTRGADGASCGKFLNAVIIKSSSSENYYFHTGCLGLRQRRATIKGSPALSCLIHFSRLLLPGKQVHLSPRGMSCYNQCQPCCQPCGPTPLASSCNEPCCRQCQSSIVVIEPSPVVVTLPGPILSSFPQNTVVGSSTSAAVGSILSCDGVPINSGCCDLSCIASCYRCQPC